MWQFHGFWRRQGWRSLYFYERQEVEKVELLFDPDQELNLVVVEFQEGGNGYTYICDDPNIHIGHAVIVPVGKENTEKLL